MPSRSRVHPHHTHTHTYTLLSVSLALCLNSICFLPTIDMIRLCRSLSINHSLSNSNSNSNSNSISASHNSPCFKITALTQTMEEVDDQPPPNNNKNQYEPLFQATKPLTTSTIASTSYYPPQEKLDFPMIYSGLFFNSNPHNNPYHHPQPYTDAADGVAGTATTTTSSYLAAAPGLLFKSDNDVGEATAATFNYMSNNSNSRWPREETMSLLQIRSRLHSSFKQATHKGPLWDEVSRIMYEEHGYQRSGKKCREKFENLYKYYKKTKEAKSGKHDGKNYRFFRQLEALYGDQNEVDHLAAQPTTISSQIQFQPNLNNQTMMVRSSSHLVENDDHEVSPHNQLHNMMNKLPCDQSCLSLSNHSSSSHFTPSSSEDNSKRLGKDKKKKNKLKMKIKEFIDIQMKSLIEQQQLCMEKVMKTIEQKEKERVLREEKWRQQAEERLEKEHKLWAKERAWMKGRDNALMETLQQITSARSVASSSHMQQVPAFSSSSPHPSLMNKKPAECSGVRDPLALYNNQESQDRWFMASNHHPNHRHHDDENNGLKVQMSDGNGNVCYGGSLLWDGSSFGLKMNEGDHESHQN